MFIAALVLGLAAPVLDLVGAIEPFGPFDTRVGHALGFVLYGWGWSVRLSLRGRWANRGA